MDLEKLVLELYRVEAVKFGTFTLKSGIESPVYFDLRVIISYPDLLDQVAEFLWKVAEDGCSDFETICGVPYTALPIATCMSVKHNKPMLIRRKEAKDYGTKKIIEGVFKKGGKCLVVEDVVTSGSSVYETVQVLSKEGVVVTDAVVLLDRGQGGKDRLKTQGINLRSVCDISTVLSILENHKKLDAEMVQKVKQFVSENTFNSEGPLELPGIKKRAHEGEENDTINNGGDKKIKEHLDYEKRAQLCSHPVAKQLLKIMHSKQTNLAFSADVTNSMDLLKLADQVGPHICILKTHVDIIEDFSQEFVQSLQALAQRHNFLIFEDRKFADIGSTVRLQYGGGMYRISDWADITNAHSVPGGGVVRGLKETGASKKRGCLLIAQMSSEGSLANGDYTKATVKMAEDNPDFVIGFICTSRISSDPKLIHMTPGVQLQPEGGDGLGQQYLTPQEVIFNRGSDIIIVGRGIYQAKDPGKKAAEYKSAGYTAYIMQDVKFTF